MSSREWESVVRSFCPLSPSLFSAKHLWTQRPPRLCQLFSSLLLCWLLFKLLLGIWHLPSVFHLTIFLFSSSSLSSSSSSSSFSPQVLFFQVFIQCIFTYIVLLSPPPLSLLSLPRFSLSICSYVYFSSACLTFNLYISRNQQTFFLRKFFLFFFCF